MCESMRIVEKVASGGNRIYTYINDKEANCKISCVWLECWNAGGQAGWKVDRGTASSDTGQDTAARTRSGSPQFTFQVPTPVEL